MEEQKDQSALTLWREATLWTRWMSLDVMLWMTLVCLLVWCGRYWFWHRSDYFFLFGNLFLAWLPYWAALGMLLLWSRRRFVWLWGLAILWLLFLPNAPYILTDMMHLRFRRGPSLWYDTFMLTLFGLHGLCLGLVSLRAAHHMAARHLSRLWTGVGLFVVLWLTGFAIFLGRFVRWHSWHVIYHPWSKAKQILGFLNPFGAHQRMWAISTFFAVIVGSVYLLLLSQIQSTRIKTPSHEA